MKDGPRPPEALLQPLTPRPAEQVPAAQRVALHEVVAHARKAPKGGAVLFAGGAGTAGMRAAEAIASELGIDAYRIDLAGVASKYIGDTEKNIDRVFLAAERTRAVLFFDEADALFGKRTAVKDAHDRYANLEVGYLLQWIEAYDGVAILATNQRADIDPALKRRLRYVVDFPDSR
jgi:SpoVK/Ycf46/Vps4 family AAA+-type ATPase